jgi:predicted dehydrogenase
VTAEFTAALTHEHQGLEAIGSEGTLFAPDPWHCFDGVIVVNGREVHLRPENSYKLQLENVSAAIRGESQLQFGRDDAVAQAATIEALYASAGESGASPT